MLCGEKLPEITTSSCVSAKIYCSRTLWLIRHIGNCYKLFVRFSSNMIRKKFINSADSAVDDCLKGTVLADSRLAYHPVGQLLY